MKQALSAIPMIPYAYTVELWRWSVFGGITTPDKYNADWWKFKNKHMGVKSPIPRPETEFDPGCFLHIDKNVEYIPYFSSQILQYTFHKALCQAAGIKKPIYKCSICKSKAAGKKLRYASLPYYPYLFYHPHSRFSNIMRIFKTPISDLIPNLSSFGFPCHDHCSQNKGWIEQSLG